MGNPAKKEWRIMRDSILGNLSNLSVRLQELEVGWINKDELGLGSARLSLVNALEGFRSSRYRLGQKLSAYKKFFKANQGWMATAKSIAEAIGCDERTIRRTIDDFERVSAVPDVVIKALQQAGFDPAARKNASIVSKILEMTDKAADMKPEIAVMKAAQVAKVAAETNCGRSSVIVRLLPPERRRRLAVRQKIRTALSSVPKERKLAELVAALEEEMYLEWGQAEPVTITITPHASDSPVSSKATRELAA
jgi:hypothetical protein